MPPSQWRNVTRGGGCSKEGAAMLGELVGPHLEQARIAD